MLQHLDRPAHWYCVLLNPLIILRESLENPLRILLPPTHPQAAEVLQRESQKLMEYARYNETKGCGVAFRALVRKRLGNRANKVAGSSVLNWLRSSEEPPRLSSNAADSCVFGLLTKPADSWTIAANQDCRLTAHAARQSLKYLALQQLHKCLLPSGWWLALLALQDSPSAQCLAH